MARQFLDFEQLLREYLPGRIYGGRKVRSLIIYDSDDDRGRVVSVDGVFSTIGDREVLVGTRVCFRASEGKTLKEALMEERALVELEDRLEKYHPDFVLEGELSVSVVVRDLQTIDDVLNEMRRYVK